MGNPGGRRLQEMHKEVSLVVLMRKGNEGRRRWKAGGEENWRKQRKKEDSKERRERERRGGRERERRKVSRSTFLEKL